MRGFVPHWQMMAMLLVTAVVVAVAVLVPVWEHFQEPGRIEAAKGVIARAIEGSAPLRSRAAEFALRNGRFPSYPGELAGGPPPAGGVLASAAIESESLYAAGATRVDARLFQKGLVEIAFYRLPPLEDAFPAVVFTPRIEGGRATWTCEARGFTEALRPAGCEPR